MKEKLKEVKSQISTILRQREFYNSKLRELDEELEELRQEEVIIKIKMSFQDFKRGA